MRLSELLGRDLREADGSFVGHVVDVRLVLDGPPAASGTAALADPVVHGLLVSPHTRESFLGYERTRVNRPAVIARFLQWRQRGTVLVLWRDVERVGDDIVLRAGARRYSPELPD
ncbi:PRC-barrel domain-containing protein [Gryllotalpicola ginsengisoli]|uniref:PRC-barrel domain-containing protein n=1 Tax=Gryllotalpicola ginsengisoli TaxID=444608 RepID=UPI0003B30452|nr:hypothetical protein [Gryllotalpicola ginsengisoli]